MALPPVSSEWRSRYDACVLPGSLYLDNPPFFWPIPAIAYGSAGMAFPCLEAGASDFLCDNWTMLELHARLYRLWQPAIACGDGMLRLRGIALTWEVGATDSSIVSILLSPAEMRIIRRLLAVPGQIVAAEALGGKAPSSLGGSRGLAMRVSRLKGKLSSLKPGLGENIKSMRNEGYLWISCE